MPIDTSQSCRLLSEVLSDKNFSIALNEILFGSYKNGDTENTVNRDLKQHDGVMRRRR